MGVVEKSVTSPMKILAFDTSTSACSIALLNHEQITSFHEIAPMQHTKIILPQIKQLLLNAKLELNQLDAIAYGCGPGSFTGIRIANSIAQALAFAQDKPLIQISSLAVLAQSAYATQGWENVWVCLLYTSPSPRD